MTAVRKLVEDAEGRDERVILYGIGWATYEALRDSIDSPGVRMTYLEGTLEIMTVSEEHESIKKRVARLLELWSVERDVRLQGFGNTTFKRKAKKRGLEPDECYVRDRVTLGARPDLAIEVVLTSGGLDKLAVYAGLGVPEVWFVEAGQIHVRVLRGGRYEGRVTSALVPELDLVQLARFAKNPDQHAAAVAYRKALAKAR